MHDNYQVCKQASSNSVLVHMQITKAICCLLLLNSFIMPSFAHDHLINYKSQYSAKETADRFVDLISAKGLTLFKRIDHQANAAGVDMELAATELILFGNPNAGTKLMQCAPTVAIDLPQKALIWEDSAGDTYLAYPNPDYLKELHNIAGCDPVLEKISGLLRTLAKEATQ